MSKEKNNDYIEIILDILLGLGAVVAESYTKNKANQKPVEPVNFIQDQVNYINKSQEKLDKIELGLYKDAVKAKNNGEYLKYYNESLKLRELNTVNHENISQINYYVKNKDYENTANAINNYVNDGVRVLNEFSTPYPTPVKMPENRNIDFSPLTKGLTDTSQINHPKFSQPAVQNHVHYVIHKNKEPNFWETFNFPVVTGYASEVNNPQVVNLQKQQKTYVKSYPNAKPVDIQTVQKLINDLKMLGLIFDYELNRFPFYNYLYYDKHPYNHTMLKYFLNRNHNLNKNRPDAKLLMDLALKPPKDFAKTEEYFIIPSFFNQAISEKTGVDIPHNWNGIYFYPTSSLSQKLSQSSQLQRQVMAQYKNGKFQNNRVYIDLDEDKNLQYSIAHATIINPKIDKYGHFHGLLYDKYDFDLLYKNKNKNLSNFVIKTNDKAFALQLIGFLRNYYIFVPINF